MSTHNNADMFFEELSEKRGEPSEGGMPLRFLEKLGAKMIPMQFYEPDALTSHSGYYYNTRKNVLYKRVKLNKYNAVWKSVNII